VSSHITCSHKPPSLPKAYWTQNNPGILSSTCSQHLIPLPLINFNIVLAIFLGRHVMFPGSYKKCSKYIQFSKCVIYVPTTFIVAGWCSVVTELWNNKLWGCKKLQRSAKLWEFLQWITFPNLQRKSVSCKLCSPRHQLKFKHILSLSEGRTLQRPTAILLKTYAYVWQHCSQFLSREWPYF